MDDSRLLTSLHEKCVDLAWRSFQDLPLAEATFISEQRLCSHATTLRVTCMPGKTNFALTYQTQAGVWRWAVCSAKGSICDEGSEGTLTKAQNIAVETLQLWFHRCGAKVCHGRLASLKQGKQ